MPMHAQGGGDRLVGGLTSSMAVARASVDKVTTAAIDNTKAVAASSSGLLQEASTSIKEVTGKTMDSEEDIRQQTLKSFKKGSVMTTKGLNKVKQMTLDMAGTRPITEPAGLAQIDSWTVLAMCSRSYRRVGPSVSPRH
eukprot:COSAG03_NODE_5531_length_1226_cov_35.799245_2_plen_139_part_00